MLPDLEKVTNDILGIMMMARDEETGQGLSSLELKDEVMTLMGAGHEVTWKEQYTVICSIEMGMGR